MDLKARLQALERASGRASASGAFLGASPGALRRDPPAPASAEAALAHRLGARVVAPGLLLRECRLEPGYRHGGYALAEVRDIGTEPLGVSIPAPERGWFFLDTETTGLAGGTGTLVFLFGGVTLDAQGFRLRQWLLTRFAGESALVEAVHGALAESRMIVTFNGKSFDLPLLRSRQRLHGRTLDEQHLVHLDLLHPARSAFATCWPDVRLQTAEARLCAYCRADDLPGAEAPLAFMRWMRSGDCEGLVRVMQHHRDDVLSLVTLCTALAAAFRDPASTGADEAGIARRLKRQGYRVRAGQQRLAFGALA